MGLRFFKRLHVAPGVTLNLSKRGASVSVGTKGAHITAGTSGTTETVGVPDTGLYYTQHQNWRTWRGSQGPVVPSGSGSPNSFSGCLCSAAAPWASSLCWRWRRGDRHAVVPHRLLRRRPRRQRPAAARRQLATHGLA